MEARVSSSVSIESGPVEIHRDRDIVHAPWSVGRVVWRVIGSSLIEWTLIVGAIVVSHIARRTIIVLESSPLIVIVVLKVSKHSSSES